MRLKCARAGLVEITLALVLLAAAALKSHQLFTGPIATPNLIFRTGRLLAGFIEVEFLLAIWLLIGGFTRLRFVCAMVCFTIFAAVSGYEAAHGAASCGCFGNLRVPPAITAVLDVSAIVALWLTRPRHIGWTLDWPTRPRPIGGISAALVGSGALWGMYFLKSPVAAEAQTGGLIVLDPPSWIGKPFPLLDEINGDADLRHGRWIVLLYHYDCEDCVRAIPIYESLAAIHRGFRVAFLAMPPVAAAGADPLADSPQSVRLTLRQDHDWFATTPVSVALKDGRVLAAVSGSDAINPPDIPAW